MNRLPTSFKNISTEENSYLLQCITIEKKENFAQEQMELCGCLEQGTWSNVSYCLSGIKFRREFTRRSISRERDSIIPCDEHVFGFLYCDVYYVFSFFYMWTNCQQSLPASY